MSFVRAGAVVGGWGDGGAATGGAPAPVKAFVCGGGALVEGLLPWLASKLDGAEVVQLYLSLLEASTPTPRRALVAFDRVWLPAGTATRVSLTLTPRLNAVMRAGDYVDVVEPGRRVVYVGGDSAAAFSAGFATVGTVTPVAVCEA